MHTYICNTRLLYLKGELPTLYWQIFLTAASQEAISNSSLCIAFTFGLTPLGKVWNTIFLKLQFFYKHGFGIYEPSNIDVPFDKKKRMNYIIKRTINYKFWREICANALKLRQIYFYTNQKFYFKQFSLAWVDSLIVKHFSLSCYSAYSNSSISANSVQYKYRFCLHTDVYIVLY